VDSQGILCLAVVVIGAAILFRLLAGNMDRDRIRDYVQGRGGRMLSCTWAPFGTGWFGDKSDRIYEVSYLDKEGNQHRATCKTSMWTGVYWTEDRIVVHAQQQPSPDKLVEPEPFQSDGDPWSQTAGRSAEELEAENRRLREELERLKRDHS
jgi:hypothetical protein